MSLTLIFFSNLGGILERQHFLSNEEVIAALGRYLADLRECYFRDDIHLADKHWTNCTEVYRLWRNNKSIFQQKKHSCTTRS